MQIMAFRRPAWASGWSVQTSKICHSLNTGGFVIFMT
jgi:hypothetical protein